MTLRRKFSITLIGTFVAVAGVALLSVTGARTLFSTVERATLATSSIVRLHHVLIDTLDVEAGANGFVITGEPSFLAPYERGRAALVDDATAVRGSLVNWGNAKDAERLGELVEAKLTSAAALIAQRRAGGSVAALMGSDTWVMTQIRDLLIDLEGKLRHELQRDHERDMRLAWTALAGVGFGVLASIVLAVGGLLSVQRSIITPLDALARAARLAGQGPWRSPIPIRDDEIGDLDLAIDAMVARREEAKQRQRELVDDAPEPYFLADLDGNLTDVNAAACALLGYARAELLAMTALDLIPREDVAGFTAIKATMLAQHIPTVSEWRLRKQSGDLVPVEISAKILADGRWQIFARDIADRARLDRERQDRITEREEMIAVVSHDLKAPLHAIELRELLIERKTKDPVAREHAIHVRSSIVTMQRLISGLLDVERTKGGTLALSRAPHSLSALTREIIEVLTPIAVEREIELRFTETAPCIVVVDRARIEQVLYNLVANALKFTPPQGSVTVTIERRDEACTLAVVDTGSGITPTDLPRVFDRYFSTDHYRGTGLGLDIARRLIEAHGGTIWATSSLGEGSTFAFRLPVEVDEAGSARAPART
ncbi:MAG: ATP-binding protein [Proteobacteria bacterium]|nr:ATP-binding protein [Pseudomonadota bacterium]